MNNWHDIEVLALNDARLHAAVTMVDHGVSREDVLIAVVIALTEQAKVFDGARLDAVVYGNGFVSVAHVGGEFRYQKLDPSSVMIHETKK